MSLAADALADRIRQGSTALGLALSDRQVAQLVGHVELVAQWTKVYNLTAVTDPQEMVVHHVLDSLAAVQPLQRVVGPVASILDVGSGAGFPGVPLAICEPGWDVTCVDTVAKKMAFVHQVRGSVDVGNLQAVHGRVERLKRRPCDVVVSRAFASLRDFVDLTDALLAPTGCWMAMKARLDNSELAALSSTIDVFHVEQLSVPGLDAARCLVWMRRH